MTGLYILGGVVLLVAGLLILSFRLARTGAVAKDDLQEAQRAAKLEEKARLAHEREDAKNRPL